MDCDTDYDTDYADWKAGDKVENTIVLEVGLELIQLGTEFTIAGIRQDPHTKTKYYQIQVFDSLGTVLEWRDCWKFQRCHVVAEPSPQLSPQLNFDF